MKHYALILGATGQFLTHLADRVPTEHRISVYEGTDALYIPVSTTLPITTAITQNFWFRGEPKWGRISPEHNGRDGVASVYTASQVATVEFSVQSLGEFTDGLGVQREIIYFTTGDGTSRRIMKDNWFDWKFKPLVILSIATLSEDSALSRSLTGSSPGRRGDILPVLQEIYKEKGWD